MRDLNNGKEQKLGDRRDFARRCFCFGGKGRLARSLTACPNRVFFRISLAGHGGKKKEKNMSFAREPAQLRKLRTAERETYEMSRTDQELL